MRETKGWFGSFWCQDLPWHQGWNGETRCHFLSQPCSQSQVVLLGKLQCELHFVEIKTSDNRRTMFENFGKHNIIFNRDISLLGHSRRLESIKSNRTRKSELYLSLFGLHPLYVCEIELKCLSTGLLLVPVKNLQWFPDWYQMIVSLPGF